MAALRIVSASQMVLMAVTWRLWFAASDVPAVPFLAINFPVVFGQLASVILFAACLGVCTATKEPAGRWAACLALLAAIVPVAMNQHCLQAWHWLFIIAMSLRLVASDLRWKWLMRHVVCSIYLCSAMSRITTNPQSGMTALIATEVMTWLSIPQLTQAESLATACHWFTAGEFLVGVLLAFASTRKWGVVTAIMLHLGLIVTLSPLGLNHHPAVLVWNVCLLLLVPSVCWPTATPARTPGDGVFMANVTLKDSQTSQARRRWQGVTAAIWLFPLSGLFGIADNWPSWQLYSNRPEVYSLQIDSDAVSKLPESLQSHLWQAPESAFRNLVTVRLDRWSLEQTGSPLYPEDRFQLAISSWCLQNLPHEIRFEVHVSKPEGLKWWKRQERTLISRTELLSEQNRFWLRATAVKTAPRP